MYVVFAIAIGVVAGAGAFLLLGKTTAAILSGDAARAALPMLGNLAIILGVLLGTALLASNYLVWMGIGLAAGLLICAVIRVIRQTGKRRNNDAEKEGKQ